MPSELQSHIVAIIKKNRPQTLFQAKGNLALFHNDSPIVKNRAVLKSLNKIVNVLELRVSFMPIWLNNSAPSM